MKKNEALMQMEASIKKYTSEIFLSEDDLYEPEKRQPPRFVTQIQERLNLVERDVFKFECQLAPVGDPNMKVEWFFNGKPLLHSKFQNAATKYKQHMCIQTTPSSFTHLCMDSAQ